MTFVFVMMIVMAIFFGITTILEFLGLDGSKEIPGDNNK